MHFDLQKGKAFIIQSLEKDYGPPLRFETEVISTVPEERLIVLYTCYWEDAPTLRLIGKYYAGDSGWTAYFGMSAVHRALLMREGVSILAAPAPLFFDSNLGLIVQEYVDGRPYYDLLKEDDVAPYFQEAGKALAVLHALDVPHGPRRTLTDNFEELIHPHPGLFAETMPVYYTDVTWLIKEMTAIEQSWGEIIETTPLHRDFHLRQLFHDTERVWLIDWDLFAKGDPSLDIGNFIVYLETRLGPERRDAVDAFLEGYLSTAPASRLKRIPLYKAFTYLRLACKRFRLKDAGWQDQVPEMLRLSKASLTIGANHAAH